MSEKTIFSKIIDREIPGYFVYEDDLCVVIMDAFPSTPGQTLVISKEPVAYVFDLPEPTYVHIMNIAKQVAKALDTVFSTSRTCMVVEGFEVPHTHIKLFPLPANQTALTNVLMHTKPANHTDLESQSKLIKIELQT